MENMTRALLIFFAISVIGFGICIADALIFGLNDLKDWFLLALNSISCGLWGLLLYQDSRHD